MVDDDIFSVRARCPITLVAGVGKLMAVAAYGSPALEGCVVDQGFTVCAVPPRAEGVVMLSKRAVQPEHGDSAHDAA